MPTNQRQGPEAELLRVAEELRHMKAEYRRTHPEGSGRRHMGARVSALEERFARLVSGWEPDEDRRVAWRDHLHAGGPAPAPTLATAPLVFRGVRSGGSRVEVRERSGDDLDLIVDGVRAERLADKRMFALPPGGQVSLGGVTCREVFEAGAGAFAALRMYVEEPKGPPPWEHARELFEDGLIDVDFGLTPRGRRALAAARVS